MCKYTYIYGSVPKRGREWLLGAEEPGKGQDSYYYCKSVSTLLLLLGKKESIDFKLKRT